MFHLISQPLQLPPKQLIQPSRIITEHVHITKTSKIIKMGKPLNIEKYRNSDFVSVEDTLEAIEKVENDMYMAKFIDENGQEFIINIPNIDNATQ